MTTYAARQQAEIHITSDILDHLTQLGLQGEELHNIAKAWMCTETEIALWAEKGNAGKLLTDRDRATREISKLATQMERAILNKGRVLSPAFLNAEPEKLLAAIDFYETKLDELWPAYQAAESPEDRAPLLETWTRLNGYLWEAKTAAEVPAVTVQVLTGTTLANKLEQTLRGEA